MVKWLPYFLKEVFMKSMTGYGYSEISCESYILSCELKSYNSRYLEINFNAPSFLSSFEFDVLSILKKHFIRGRIECNFKVKNLKNLNEIEFDKDLFKKYACLIQNVESNNSDRDKVGLSNLLSFDGVLNINKDIDNSIYKDDLFSLLNQSIEKVIDLREREGNNLKDILATYINQFELLKDDVSLLYKSLEDKIKTNLQDRCDSLLIDKNISQDRILSEIAILLMKYTIEEELVRLDSHIKFFKENLDLDKPVGKKLDFLAQEMNREVNTIGSKNTISDISNNVISMKEIIENIREQLRNVE